MFFFLESPCVHVQDMSGLASLVSYDFDPFLQAPFQEG